MKKASWGKLGGPTGRMHGWSGTGTQSPGGSSQEGSGGKTGIAPKAGGKDPLSTRSSSNKDFAGTQVPGQSASTKTGGNSLFAAGGKGSMFGKTGSRPAPGGRSSH